MKHISHISHWLGCLTLGSCLIALPSFAATPSPPTSTIAQARREFVQPDFQQHFEDLDIEGSIIIYSQNQEVAFEYNRDRNTTPFLPASTFKILNSLISLETGVIANDLAILTWDGIERSYSTWNRDLNLRTAFQISAVWFYQVLARRVGHERMQQWVTDANYGNQTIGSAEEIDTFWLTGDIRITPQQQIQFLRRLYNNDLPFSERTVAMVKDIMIVEQTPDYTMRAKTGWALAEELGWYVGYVEQNNNVYFFATNIDMLDGVDPSLRAEVTRRCLAMLNLL
ncbi:class D beta-lactamase [Leptothoe sp. ISB3NOV94-8A]